MAVGSKAAAEKNHDSFLSAPPDDKVEWPDQYPHFISVTYHTAAQTAVGNCVILNLLIELKNSPLHWFHRPKIFHISI